jgi:hypothetical protein
MPGQVQINPDKLVDLLSHKFQRRNEPNFAWGNVTSMYMMLMRLRGFWPMSVGRGAGGAADITGGNRLLTNNNTAVHNLQGLVPYISFNGTNQWLHRNDEAIFDILGTEAYVASALRGLTFGAWCRFDVTPVGQEQVIGKYNAIGDQRSYRILRRPDKFIRAQVSVNGIDVVLIESSSLVEIDTWAFLVARFDPSTELAVFINNEKTVNTTGIPASVFNSSSTFDIGANGGGAGEFMDGDVSLAFLCAAALPDYVIYSLYHHSRVLFGL